MAAPHVTRCLIRAGQSGSTTGAYDWAVIDDHGAVLDSDSALLRQPPAKSVGVLILASELVLLEEVAVSAAQQRRLGSSLRFLVEEGTIPDPERLHVVAAPARAKNVLNVAVVDRQWMAQMIGRLDRQGLAVRAAYPECLLPDLPAQGWVVVWNGEHSFARTGSCDGFTLDVPREGEAPVALRLAMEKARGRSSAPDRIVVRPAAGVAAPALDSWAAALGVPVEAGPAWHWASAWRQPSLDLMQAEFASRAAEGGWTQSLRRSALLAAVLAVVTFSGTALDWLWKVRERNLLTAQMGQLFRNTFGDNAVVVDAPLQMRRALDLLHRQAGQPGADDFLVLLGAAAERWLDPARVRIDSIAYGEGALTLVVRPIEAAQFSALLGEMRNKPSAPGLEAKFEPAQSSGTISLRLSAGGGTR